MKTKTSKEKPVSEMTEAEKKAELERLRAEAKRYEEYQSRLREIGYWEWRCNASQTPSLADAYLAGYNMGREESAR